MKKVLTWCKDLFPLLPSGLAVILVASVLITSQPEITAVSAYTPEAITIAETTASVETQAAKKKEKKKFETKELPEKSAAAGGGGGQQQSNVSFAEGGTYKDGTYTGSSQGFGGTVGVSVTIKDGKISSISVTQSAGETASYFARARAVINKILNKQSPNVDVVSGATYSSKGIINAVKIALNKARTDGKKEETEAVKETESKKEKETKKDKDNKKETQPAAVSEDGYKDGTFTGIGEGFGGTIKVKVTIKKGKIKKIEVVSAKDETPEFFDNAKKIIPSIVSAQSTDVDTISGATYSSEGILEAVYNALKKAEKKPSPTKEESKKETEKETEKETKKETESSKETASTEPEESSEEESSEKESGSGEETPEASEAETSPTETEAPAKVYKDGTWTGSAVCQGYNYTMTAKVVIEDDVIKSITVTTTDGGSNAGYISYAVDGMTKRGKHIPGVPEQIISKQSVSGIDAVSGATYSSNAIKSAVKSALESAKN